LPPLEGWVRVIDAARLLGVSHERVRQLVQRGVLRAERLGPRTILVELASVQAYKRTRRPPGRPPNASTD
jgi:excisionase family DNA binding protein